jgi:imidazolonepropionase-like amidohydrolase
LRKLLVKSKFARFFVSLILSLVLRDLGDGQQSPAASRGGAPVMLFQNVRIYDGKGSSLSALSNVLVRGNKIERISTGPIPVDRRADTQIIEGGGRTLMPGLIDAHWHAMLIRPTATAAITGDVGYTNLLAALEARDTLMRGFTAVRDLGGPVFGLKRAIDENLWPGPRIYPSGAVITVTSGHGDFASYSSCHEPPVVR